MDAHKNDFAIVIQEYLDLITKQGIDQALGVETCIIAFELTVVQKWVNLPRVVALIRNEESQQTALFIFAGARISETVVSFLVPSELLAVDKTLTCDSDPNKSTHLRITSRDLSPRRSHFSRPGSTTPVTKALTTTPPDNLKSKSIRTTMGPRELESVAQNSSKMSTQKQLRFRSIVLAFEDVDSANQFRTELALELSRQSARFCNPPPSVDATWSWLDKYRIDITTRSCAQTVRAHRPSFKDAPSCGNFDEMAGDNPSISPSSFTSSTSSDSLDEAEEVEAVAAKYLSLEPNAPPPRTLSEPALGSVVVAGGESQEGVMSESTHWQTGDCSADEVESTLMAAAAKSALATRPPCAYESLSDLSGLPRSDKNFRMQKDQRHAMSNFMPDPIYRARLSADSIVRTKLEEDESSYCYWKTLNLFIGTWNVNGRQDSLLNLDSWMSPLSDRPPADIYVFGFQELDLNPAGMALNKQTASPFEKKWLWLLESAMGGLLKQSITLATTTAAGPSPARLRGQWFKHTGGGYKRLSIVRLAGLLLVVYVSNRLHHRATLSEVSVQAVPTGMFNVMGNKGAVGLRLTVYNHSICFVNCHLAAGSANCERRNQDYGEISRKMMFERQSDNEPPRNLCIADHDHVFIFGDLNYRVVGLDVANSLAAISRNQFATLLAFDELLSQMALGRTFQGFTEETITFRPTYKFDLISNYYYTAEGRTPSYCDRILWKGKFVEQLFYRSHNDFNLSDHKPVSAYFKIGVRCVDRQLFMKAYEAVIRSQDLFYNMLLPQARLSTQEVDFGPVHFEEIQQHSITLTNTGHSVLEFKFMQEGAAAFPSWLHVTPPHAKIAKGASCEITFDVYVNPEAVAAIQSGIFSLSCIIVLTLVGGKDFFISISGRFIPTSFGMPLSLLLLLPDTPIANIPPDDLKQMIRDSRVGDWQEGERSLITQNFGSVFQTAKEVYRMTNFIAARFNKPDLFRQPELRSDLPIIRDILDTTTFEVPIPDNVSVHSVIYCLLVFLSALPEPVIPYAFQKACLASVQTPYTNPLSAYRAVSKMPIDYQNLFFYLVSFIKRCLSYSKQNGTSIGMLTSTFADIILREAPIRSSQAPEPATRNAASSAAAGQQLLSNRQELKNAFFQIFITTDTEDILRHMK